MKIGTQNPRTNNDGQIQIARTRSCSSTATTPGSVLEPSPTLPGSRLSTPPAPAGPPGPLVVDDRPELLASRGEPGHSSPIASRSIRVSCTA